MLQKKKKMSSQKLIVWLVYDRSHRAKPEGLVQKREFMSIQSNKKFYQVFWSSHVQH